MGYSLRITPEAESDLDELWEDEKTADAAAEIEVFLEEARDDQNLLDLLTVHDFGSRPLKGRMHVSKWFEYWNQGADLWRVKLWCLEDIGLKYRIVYAYERTKQTYHILAIVERDWDYDSAHPITNRILASYRSINN